MKLILWATALMTFVSAIKLQNIGQLTLKDRYKVDCDVPIVKQECV